MYSVKDLKSVANRFQAETRTATEISAIRTATEISVVRTATEISIAR
ncbi:hypothetical protein [Lysinibacillus sp. NPDC093688]